jgi:hypothetical protein
MQKLKFQAGDKIWSNWNRSEKARTDRYRGAQMYLDAKKNLSDGKIWSRSGLIDAGVKRAAQTDIKVPKCTFMQLINFQSDGKIWSRSGLFDTGVIRPAQTHIEMPKCTLMQ